MTPNDKIKYGLIALALIIGASLVFTFIHNISYIKDEVYKQRLADKDSLISAIKSERTTLFLLLDERNQRIYEHEKNDSIASINYQKGLQVHNSLNDKLSKIPSHIQSIANNNDSLRLELSRYD